MDQSNHLPPENMTPKQRRQEVASLLAKGLVRLRTRPLQQISLPFPIMAEDNRFELDSSGNQSVHADPSNTMKTESE